MLTIVIAKPIQFTIVNDAPLDPAGAFLATMVENSGESAITVIPHINRNITSVDNEPLNKNKGENKQQAPDKNNAIAAILFSPQRCEINPLITHAILPDAMIRKDRNGILKLVAGKCFLYVVSITGTKTQKA